MPNAERLVRGIGKFACARKVGAEPVAEADLLAAMRTSGGLRQGLTPWRAMHATALVDPGAKLADDVEVGAYSIVGPAVEIGAGTVIGPHAVVTGRTRIGARNRIWQFTSIGDIPQDRKYGGEPTATAIGDDNIIREFVSIHAGTAQDRGETTIGNANFARVHAHRARLRRRQQHDVLEQRAARGPRAHRRLGGAGRLFRRAPVLPRRRARDDRRRRDRAAGRAAVHDRRTAIRRSRTAPTTRACAGAASARRRFSPCAARTRRSIARDSRSRTRRPRSRRRRCHAPALRPLTEFLAASGRGIVR